MANYKDYMQGWPVELQAEMQAALEDDRREVPIDSQDSVKSKGLSAPPLSPIEGDRYLIVSPTPTGDWVGKSNHIAQKIGATWAFTSPSDGMMVWVEDEDLLYVYATTAWVPNPLAAHALDGLVHTGATVAALAGTNGVPSGTNKYVTDSDPRNLDARTPVSHVLNGLLHSVSGLTAGHVMRASAPTAADFAQLQHADLGGVGATDHHSNVNDPSTGEKSALAGTSGVPNSANRFLTEVDPVLMKFTSAVLTYYVNLTTGDDTLDGLTPGTAWKSLQKANDATPYSPMHHVLINVSGLANEIGPTFVEKNVMKDRLYLVDCGNLSQMMSAMGGVGDSLAKSGSIMTLTDASANFTAAIVGKIIVIQDVTTVGNGGAFVVTAVPSPTTIQWTNASGVTEAFVGTWRILPFDTVTTGTGDDLAFSGGDVTLTDAGASFTDSDKNRQITIAGATSPANNVTAIIHTVVSKTQIIFANASGVTETFTGTWTLGNYVADSTSSSHIGLKTSNWGKDQWMALKLEIVTGAAAGQSRSVHASDVAEINNTVPSGTGDSLSFNAVGNVVTLTDAGASFLTTMLGGVITIAGSTTPANDGPFTITEVVSNTQVRWVNAAGVTEAFPGTWTLPRKFSGTAPAMTFTDFGAQFSPRMAGKKITFASSTTPANDVTVTILTVPTPHSFTFSNAAGVAENFPGTWTTENGWVTPTRNYSIDPGIGAQFRFVRPLTTFQASTTASPINVKNTGLGTLAFQGFSTLGSNVAVLGLSASPGPLYFADIVLGSTVATQLSLAGANAPTIDGAKYSTTTFVRLTTTTDPFCGVTSYTNPVSSNMTINLRSAGFTSVRGMVVANYIFMRQCNHSVFSQGCRFGSGVFINNSWFQFGAAIQNTAGYAVTRFGGHGAHPDLALPGVVAYANAGISIAAGCEISECFDSAVEIQQSKLSGGAGGAIIGIKNRRWGLYIWNQSQMTLPTAVFGGPCTMTRAPTGALGDVSVDRINPETTWAKLISGTPLVDIAKQMVLIQRGYQLY